MFTKNTDLETDTSIAGNHHRMKRNERTLSILIKIYLFTCIPYAAISLFMIILTVKSDTFMTFLDGIVAKAAVLVLGFQGCYKHQPKLTWAAVIVQFLCVCLSGFTYFDAFFSIIGIDMNDVLIILFIACAVINMRCAAEYAYLEQQTGFPQFSEIFEEQKEKKRRFEESDPFEERKKQLSANSSSDMNELDLTSRSTDNGSTDRKGDGIMDEI